MLQVLRNSLVKKKLVSRIFATDLEFQAKASYSCQAKLKEDAEEVKIPVPWGHIAGKWWRRSDEIPMLVVHGWQDNAGSFDKLIPLLNISNLLAIDLPGHGLSSHYPPGKLYTFPEYLYSLRRVIDHFKWEKYSIMGHSLGSALGFANAAVYKGEVQCLISLECARYILLAYTEDFPNQYAKGLNKIVEYDDIMKSDTPPRYTLPDAIDTVIAGSLGSVTSLEAATTLLERGAIKQKGVDVTIKKNKGNILDVFLKHELSTGAQKSNSDVAGSMEEIEKSTQKLAKEKLSGLTDSGDYVYQFTKDPRVKIIQFGMFSMDIWNEMSKNIFCPMLSVEGDQGFLRFGSLKLYQIGNGIVKKHSKHFEHHVVAGNHHLQLNSPENVAPVINNFLQHVK